MHYVKKEEVTRLRVIMSIIKNFFRRGNTRSLMCTSLQEIILFLRATLLKIRVWYTVPKTHKRHHHEHNHMCSQTFTTLLHYLPCLVFDNYTVIYFMLEHICIDIKMKKIFNRGSILASIQIMVLPFYNFCNSSYALSIVMFKIDQI